MVGVVMLVMRSDEDVPESEAAGSTATGGATGAVVSTVMASVPEKPETLPARSVAVVLRMCVPVVSAVPGV